MFHGNSRGKINLRALIILVVVMLLLAGSLCAAYKVRKAYIAHTALAAGEDAYEHGQWEVAIREYSRYLDRHPSDTHVLGRYAQSSLWMQPLEMVNISHALEAYRRLARYEPQNAEAYWRMVELDLSRGDYDDLRHIAQMWLDRQPAAPEPVIWMAQALLEQPGSSGLTTAEGMLTPLVKRLENDHSTSAEHAKACRLLALCAVRGGEGRPEDRAGRGRQWADRAVTYQADNPAGYIFRARFLQEHGSSLGLSAEQAAVAAAGDLTKAQSLEINNPLDWVTVSEVWTMLGQYSSAQWALSRAEAADARTIWKYCSDADIWRTERYAQTVRLGVLSGQPQAALAMTGPVLEATHRVRYRLKALESAVKVNAQTDHAAEARRLLDEYIDTISRSPNATALLADPHVVFMRVIVLRIEDRPDRWQEIIKLLHPLLATQSVPPELHHMLGEAYGQTYQARLAVHELMTYLTLLGQQGLPPTPILLHELVIVQRQRGDLASALYYARQLEQAAPKQVELRLERLEIEVVATDGRHDEKAAARLAELRQELQDVRAKVGDSPGLTILEAQTWVNAGNPKRAEELLRQTAATDKTPQSRMELIAFLVQQGAGRRGDALDQCRQLIKEHADLAGGYKALATLQEEQGNAQQARTTLTDGVAAAAAADKRGLEVELALFDLRHEKRPEALARLEKLRQQDKQDVRLRSLMLEMADAAGDRAWAESLVEEIKAVQGDGGLLWRYYRARLLMNDSNWRDKREEIGSLLQACRMIDPGLAAAVLLLGELDEREGQVDQAALTYETALRDNPGSMELAGKLIRLLEGQKRFAEVADVLDSLVGADPRRVADLRIHIALGGGDTAAAMDELRRRIAADPKDATSRVSLAQLLYAQRQDVDGALELLEQARRIDPQSLLPAAAQISILRSSGRGEEVLPLLDREVARQDTFESRLLRGTYLARIGRNDLADADFATLPERNDQGDGQLKQAQHYLATWRVAQAQGVLADGVTRYPANTALKEQSIRLLLGSPQAQRRQEGLAMLEKLLAAHPENPDLRVMQARALLVQGDPAAVQKAEAIARDMARRFPLLIDAHLALAQVLAQRGDFAEMQQVLVEALRSNSDSIPLLLQLAQAQDELGNTTAARETVSQAIAAAPLFGPARAFGVQLALRHGDKAYLADQLSSLQDALASAPEDEQLQLTQAVALEQLGRPDAAVAALEAFIKNGPAGARSFNVYLMLCDLHRQAGRLEKAQQCYQSACAAAGDERQLLSERLMLLGAQGQYDQVVEAINALPADWTVDERTVQTAATVLDASGRPEYRQAARQWCLQLAKSAESLPVRYRLANLIYSDGDTETALALYEDLYRQAPDHPNVLNDLAWILAHQKGDEPVARAIELSTKAVMINPSDGHLRHTRAFALSASRRQEDWAEGAQEYERFLGLVRESPSQQALGQAEMGLLLVRLNLKDQARSALTEAVKLDAQGAKLSQALRQQVQDALAGLK